MQNSHVEFLIIGLGNPGEEYESTRHNAGFRVVDALTNDARVNYWKTQGGALVASASLSDVPIVFAKPQSFMNLSGGPTKALSKEYGVAPENIIVVHDELDIPAGSVKVKFGGGHAGHNGLKSICEKLGTKDFLRVRTGIGRPPGRMDVAKFVLSTPKGEDAALFEEAIERATQALRSLITQGLEKTQQAFN